jgi:hypothetical protein
MRLVKHSPKFLHAAVPSHSAHVCGAVQAGRQGQSHSWRSLFLLLVIRTLKYTTTRGCRTVPARWIHLQGFVNQHS